jgi:Xaa-Pro dipeptidase
VFRNPFDDEELAARLTRLRSEMAEQAIDVAVISTPENIFYLTGLDHWGYFAPHVLIVPADGRMTLITRAMERATFETQVRNALFEGHGDDETAADLTVRHLALHQSLRRRLETALGEAKDVIEGLPENRPRIGAETWSAGHAYAFGTELRAQIEDADWIDITGLVDGLRLVKSPKEQALMREAAAISDRAAEAAIIAVRDGAREADVAAECVATMIRHGGQPPGFGPFIRPASRLGEEHATWGDGIYRTGERVFLELSGCVARYHAPLGRLVHIGSPPEADLRMAELAEAAYRALLGALKPGARAGEVYDAWQAVVDGAGLVHYRRHHCGYCVGIGFPPSWTGGNAVTGLRHGSTLEIREGMTFHILSWLMGTGRGDFFLSNCVLLGANGPETLTRTPCMAGT